MDRRGTFGGIARSIALAVRTQEQGETRTVVLGMKQEAMVLAHTLFRAFEGLSE